MLELSEILHKKRETRGSLDFDFPEAKILLDKEGKPTSIEKYEITVSNHIIEEFMLLANETIAEHVFWLGVPLMYRVHETPSGDKIETFAKVAKQFGYYPPVANVFKTGRTDFINAHAPFSHEGRIQRGKFRAFWSCIKVLLPLHLPHSPLSRFNGSQSGKRTSSGFHE